MTSLYQDLCRTVMQYCCEYHYTHLHVRPTSYTANRACFGCGIDVKSDDRRALDNAEAKDVVVVWKAFLEEC